MICQLKNFSDINLSQEYIFTAKTKDEYSVICPESIAPKECIKIEYGWECFYIAARQETGILVVATFDIDYILIKEEKMEQVKQALINEKC